MGVFADVVAAMEPLAWWKGEAWQSITDGIVGYGLAGRK